jgi:hypothetical protein
MDREAVPRRGRGKQPRRESLEVRHPTARARAAWPGATGRVPFAIRSRLHRQPHWGRGDGLAKLRNRRSDPHHRRAASRPTIEEPSPGSFTAETRTTHDAIAQDDVRKETQSSCGDEDPDLLPASARCGSLIDRSDPRQSRSMPATWMMPAYGSLPAPVSTALPTGHRTPASQRPKRFEPGAALDCPGHALRRSSHHGNTFRFHALTMTSAFCSSRSPSMTSYLTPRASVRSRQRKE